MDWSEHEKMWDLNPGTRSEVTVPPTNLPHEDIFLWPPLGLEPLPGCEKPVFSSQGQLPCGQRVCLLLVP